jgi:hypothetical protein
MGLRLFARGSNVKVTVVINNRNLLTWPREMVSRIEKYENLAGIILVDNQSSYPPLLEWYQTSPHPVIRLDGNVGHEAPFSQRVLDAIPTEDFVVTDPDLGLLDTPNDTLTHLRQLLHQNPALGKVGLSLDWRTVPRQSPYYAHCHGYERELWDRPQIGLHLRSAPVDTTLAVYNKKIACHYFIGGARTEPPYTARHYPWELVGVTEEYRYYLDRASTSSSFKSFLAQMKSD